VANPVIANVIETDDGVSLTYYELGAGRPVVLLHSYMFPTMPTWVDTKIAERLADDGHRLIMLDLRGHGASVPASDAAYPPDALTKDTLSLIDHLELRDYDLGGYSLGARIVARALTLGATPRRAFIAGTGLDPIVHASGRGENYRRILSKFGEWDPDTPEAELESYLKQVGANPAALIRVLDTLVDTAEEDLARVEVPTLVIAGHGDGDRGSVEDLASLLPNARLQRVPGDHFSALASTELKDQLARFLSDDELVGDIPGTRRP
jgi:pimeloyl-ACP methyl ester carboxylesterase